MLGGLIEGFVHLEVRLSGLELLIRDQLLVLLANAARPSQRSLCLVPVGAGLRGRGLGGAEGRLRAPERGAEGRRVDDEQRVTPDHDLALVHAQLDDPTRDIGLDVDAEVGADPPAGRDQRDEVAPLDLLAAHLDAAAATLAKRQCREHADHQRDANPDEYLLLLTHTTTPGSYCHGFSAPRSVRRRG